MSYVEIDAVRVLDACAKFRRHAVEWRQQEFDKEVKARMKGFWRCKSAAEAEEEVSNDHHFMMGLKISGGKWDMLVEKLAALARAVAPHDKVHLDEEAAYTLRDFL